VYKGDSKFQVDPDNNRIRLRDHSYVSGNLYVSGSIITADGTSPDHISGLSGYFGKVGIGTTNMGAAPDALTVGALVAGNTKTVQFNSEGGSEIGLKVMSRTNRAVIKVGDNDTNSYIVSEGATSSFGPAASLSASNINLFGGGTVGIGTTTSNGALLTVNGDASITGELKIKNNAYWYDPDSTDIIAKLYDSSDDGIFDVYQNNSPTVRLHGNGDSFFKGGDVFIGPSSPGSLLGIQESQDNSATWWTNAAAQVTIYNNSTAAGSASVLKFQTTSSAGSNARIVYGAATAADKLIFSSRLTEDYNLLAKAGQFACFNAYGSLGLGTLTPEAKLQVSGDASITGELKVNGEVHIPNNLVHKGDTDTYLNFNADRIRLNAGGVELIDAREAGADYVAIGGVGDNPDVNFLVGSAVNGIDYVLEVDAGSSAVGINCDPLDAKGAALVVSGDASITGELRAVDAIFGGASQTRLKVYNDGTYAGIQTDGGGLHEIYLFW
jgi:cytoskeletal protein CcmA (bactofilin family)